MTKKFKFEDLQPHLDMLLDALENKGASPTGIPYSHEVYLYPPQYRELLNQIRNKTILLEDLLYSLETLKTKVLVAAGNNQKYRINNLICAIDTYMIKEYYKK